MQLRPPVLLKQGRDHSEFIVRLKDYMPTKQSLVDGLLSAAEQQFDLQVGL